MTKKFRNNNTASYFKQFRINVKHKKVKKCSKNTVINGIIIKNKYYNQF